MSYELVLPRNIIQREVAINNIIKAGEGSRHVKEVDWWFAHYYLQGVRNFSHVNYQAGTIDVNYINEEGILRFRYDDIVSKYQAQLGRLMQIDLAPRTTKKSVGLEDLRRASIAQVALNAAFPPSKVQTLKLQMLPPLTKYGCVGLAVWNEREEINIEVVMPWELIPIPPTPVESKDIRGLIRVRMVPLEWIQRLPITPGKGAKVYEQMESITVPAGRIPLSSGERFAVFGEDVVDQTTDSRPYGSERGIGAKKDETHQVVVKMAEVWTKDSAGYLNQYNLMAGGKHLHSVDYVGTKTYMPIQICNDMLTGGFWGRSFVSCQIPMNTELEYSIGRMFQYIQDIDAYGILCLPSTIGVPAEVLRAGDGTKRIVYEPDYTVPELKPFNIAPMKAGPLAPNIIKIAVGLADKIANQPTAMMQGDAPGRVDSSSGLGFLFEVSNTPLTPTATCIASAVSNCYRAMLNIMQVKWPDEKLVQVTMLDDTLAGISLDAASGTMKLKNNVLPHPDEIEVAVASMLPQSKEQEKMELQRALELQAIDMTEYRIEVRKRGLDIPVGNEIEWQNYRRAMLENILLFGDGQTPGQVLFDASDLHLMHLRVLRAFKSRPEYYQASPAVRTAFTKHDEAHVLGLGNQIPEQAPFPEEAAEETDMMEKAMAQGGPQQ